MHTFNTEANGTVTVGRLEHAHVGDMGAANFVPMRKFNNLHDAVRFINFLNGGDISSSTAGYVNSLLEKGWSV